MACTIDLKLRGKRPCGAFGSAGRPGHNGDNLREYQPDPRVSDMPSLFRFLFVVGLLAGLTVGGLYVLASFFEPEPQEVTQPVPGVKIRR